mgnify:CR=1 FL=1
MRFSNTPDQERFTHMTRAFYIILAAQFFSSLADNALLIASIALLREMIADRSQEPLLKAFFTVSYVLLAPFVGAFADSRPKGNVMFITNTIKVIGCAIMLFGVHPMLAYAVVGLGAAAYSPAKYGIITELLPAEKLVVANGWMEAATILSIIFGTVLGGFLSSSFTHNWRYNITTHHIITSNDGHFDHLRGVCFRRLTQSRHPGHRRNLWQTGAYTLEAHYRFLAMQPHIVAR